jgi:hypothetical protein
MTASIENRPQKYGLLFGYNAHTIPHGNTLHTSTLYVSSPRSGAENSPQVHKTPKSIPKNQTLNTQSRHGRALGRIVMEAGETGPKKGF